MAQSEFGLHKIGQVAVPVTRLGRSIVFYRDELGMNFLFQAPPGLAFFDVGGVRLLLDAAAEGSTEKRSSIIYYQVEDIEVAYKKLMERGVDFDQPPQFVAKMPDHELWMAFLRDPDDNTLALMCEKR
jgi:methylmalonyl-CoA/ethylmalonyl-CoA epimerase